MNYGFKVTSRGEALIAACMDLGAPLKITRAAVGSGLAGGSLAETHALVHYVADASIGERRHEGNRLFLSVQYRNDACPELGDFVLSEFIVYAQDPETGQESDLLYATLGDSRQPVPGFKSGFPASVWTFPVVLIVSGELRVDITASPGIVTFYDLQDAIDRLIRSIMMNELTLPLTTTKGEQILTTDGTPIMAVYHPDRSAGILAAMEALERRMETDAESVAGQIAAAKAEAISTASTDAAEKDKALEGYMHKYIETAFKSYDQVRITKVCSDIEMAFIAARNYTDVKISAHDGSEDAHPTHISIVKKS